MTEYNIKSPRLRKILAGPQPDPIPLAELERMGRRGGFDIETKQQQISRESKRKKRKEQIFRLSVEEMVAFALWTSRRRCPNGLAVWRIRRVLRSAANVVAGCAPGEDQACPPPSDSPWRGCSGR